MSGLVDKINEMIDILHEIDPAAAAEFRGGSKDVRTPRAVISEPPEVVQNVPPVHSTKIRKNKSTVKMNADQSLRSTEPLADLLKIELKSENLVEAIIFSEIIGKPISKRHGGRRF